MDHSTLVFASVFPVLSLSHTTPTPIATPDLGHTAPGSSFGSPYAARNVEVQGQNQHRAVRRGLAWSCATRFLSSFRDASSTAKLHKSREVNEALVYLLVGEGRSADAKDESLVDWYLNECRIHFANVVRPELDQLWSAKIELDRAWDVLDQTQDILESYQQIYVQPFIEHILYTLQRDSGGSGKKPSRPTQMVDMDAVTRVSRHFQSGIHALFAHSLPLQRYSKTLSYILYDAGCRLFRIYTRCDGVEPSTSPEDTKASRQRMTALLQALERVGLGGDLAQKAFAHSMNKLLDSFITGHYLKVDWYAKSCIVPHLNMWIQDGFCPLAELVLECLQCEQSSILPTEVASWQEMALGRLGRARVDNLFDFVINWDRSLGAVLDIKEYLKVVGAKQHLTSSFAQQISRRLLHPGATTTYILNVYILIIRSFHKLEPKGVLLERVARPIRRYLKEREDTARIIIASLLTDLDDETGTKFSSMSELSYEIACEMAKPISNYGQETDEEMNWNDMNWQPLPQDASPEYKKSKVEDVIWFLMTLWERDDFINELRNILGDHLLRCQDPEYQREIRLLELIKVRLGDDKMQACEVMLRDVLDSKRINASIKATITTPLATALVTPQHDHEHTHPLGDLHPRTPQPRRTTRSTTLALSTPTSAPSISPTLNAQILSSFFWPLLRDDTFRVPLQIDALQQDYSSRFSRIKGMRKLHWMPALGNGSITLSFDDRTEDFSHLTPWQVSVVYAFQPQAGEEHMASKRGGRDGDQGIARNVQQLQDMLDMDAALVKQALAFWVGKSVLRQMAPSTYAVIERLPRRSAQAQADEDAAVAAEELAAVQAAETTAVKSTADLFNEKKDVYCIFITTMLGAQGNLDVARILTLMRLMVQGGFPFGEGEVQGLLEEMEGQERVVSLGAGVWTIKK